MSNLLPEPCLHDTCRSPVACIAFGYCRVRNLSGSAYPRDFSPSAKARRKCAAQEAHAGAILAELREAGWMVVCHNDYIQNGQRMTFWSFARADRYVKGEGSIDLAALSHIRRVVFPPPPDAMPSGS